MLIFGNYPVYLYVKCAVDVLRLLYLICFKTILPFVLCLNDKLNIHGFDYTNLDWVSLRNYAEKKQAIFCIVVCVYNSNRFSKRLLLYIITALLHTSRSFNFHLCVAAKGYDFALNLPRGWENCKLIYFIYSSVYS